MRVTPKLVGAPSLHIDKVVRRIPALDLADRSALIPAATRIGPLIPAKRRRPMGCAVVRIEQRPTAFLAVGNSLAWFGLSFELFQC